MRPPVSIVPPGRGTTDYPGIIRLESTSDTCLCRRRHAARAFRHHGAHKRQRTLFLRIVRFGDYREVELDASKRGRDRFHARVEKAVARACAGRMRLEQTLLHGRWIAVADRPMLDFSARTEMNGGVMEMNAWGVF